MVEHDKLSESKNSGSREGGKDAGNKEEALLTTKQKAELATVALKSLLPMLGDKKVRSKLDELESEAMSLPIIFGILTGKVIENLIVYNPEAVIRFGGAAALVGVTFVWRHEAKKKAKEVKESVSEE